MKKLLALATVGMLLAPTLALASVNINLTGGNVTVRQGQGFSEPGYSANSTVDGDVTGLVSVTGVDTSVGSHTISYNVTDSALDSATASRTFTVVSEGSLMPYCSGPSAPGWQMGLDGGGCGGTGRVVPAGATYTVGNAGAIATLKVCPFWFVGGCLVK